MSASSAVVFGCGVLFIIAGFMAIAEVKPNSLIIAYLALGVANMGFGAL